MASGYGRGAGFPLKDRVRRQDDVPGSAAEPEDEVPPPATAAVASGAPGRHCWVTGPVDGGDPRPGLLLEWRRTSAGWEGRVVYVAQPSPGRWAAVEEWLPANQLHP